MSLLHRIGTWWAHGHSLLPDGWTYTKDYTRLTWLGRAVNLYHSWTRWLRWSWWSYVWQAPQHYSHYGPDANRWTRSWDDLNRWEVRWCRLRGHPGIVYYNSGGLEPDTSCKRCGEQIG